MLRSFLLAFCVLTLSTAASAVDGDQVLYSTGTLSKVRVGTIGRFDLSNNKALTFESSGGNVTVPYAQLEAFTYEMRVARHLGVLPAIAVGLVRYGQHRHFFRFAFKDDAGVSQIAEFEVAKEAPPLLNSLLQQRAPKANCLVSHCRIQFSGQ